MRIQADEANVQKVFEEAKDHEAFRESREIVARGGQPAQMLQVMTLRPELLDALGQFSEGLYPGGLLERRLKERVIVKASELNNCQFCGSSHRALMARLGLLSAPDAPLREGGETERERLALVYTVEMMNNANAISDVFFEELRGEFSDPEIVELTLLVGYINMLNLFNNALGIEYQDEYDALP
ncbi:MAG: carboxymuconolactone decarboxylase family protein [Myxococcota bacterium]